MKLILCLMGIMKQISRLTLLKTKRFYSQGPSLPEQITACIY